MSRRLITFLPSRHSSTRREGRRFVTKITEQYCIVRHVCHTGLQMSDSAHGSLVEQHQMCVTMYNQWCNGVSICTTTNFAFHAMKGHNTALKLQQQGVLITLQSRDGDDREEIGLYGYKHAPISGPRGMPIQVLGVPIRPGTCPF